VDKVKRLICKVFGHRFVGEGEPFNTMSMGIPMQPLKCKRCGKTAYESLIKLK